MLLPWVNQTFPSGPAVIPRAAAEVGSGNSLNWPPGVIRPIWLAWCSVNQTLPSGPLVIPRGELWDW
jgi:hypothetical protein